MRIDSNLGYRELEKLGYILKELGDKGNFRGWQFEIEDLEITYNSSYDNFELTDGENTYVIDLCEI